MNDRDFLLWIYDRFEHVHGEDPLVDYMQRLHEIIQAMPVCAKNNDELTFEEWDARQPFPHRMTTPEQVAGRRLAWDTARWVKTSVMYRMEQAEALIEKLRPYLKHKYGCPVVWHQPNTPYDVEKCTCGLWKVCPPEA